MHTIGIFKDQADAEAAVEHLDREGVPSSIEVKSTPSGNSVVLVRTVDPNTDAALEKLSSQTTPGLMVCKNCGSHNLDYPSTPNHTFLSRVAGAVAVKTHLIEEHVICADCRNEWTP